MHPRRGPDTGRVSPGHRRKGERGFSLGELVIAIALFGILFGLGLAYFLPYYQTAQLTSAAKQVRALLNQARELAITQNSGVCVSLPSTTQMQFYLNAACTGTAWIGPGTDSAGNVSLPQGVTVTASANPVFSYLGAALPAATYTITAATGSTATVSVALSGRITSP